MAKNKVYLMFFLALLLAGYAVICGCAGDTAGSSTEREGSNVNEKPVEIQWEPKIYWTGTIDDHFDGKRIAVVMDKNVGGPNKIHDKSFFGGIEIESIRDLTWFTNDYMELGIDWENWRQLLCLTLPGDSKENVVRAIRHLETIDGIRSAEPGSSVPVGVGNGGVW